MWELSLDTSKFRTIVKKYYKLFTLIVFLLNKNFEVNNLSTVVILLLLWIFFFCLDVILYGNLLKALAPKIFIGLYPRLDLAFGMWRSVALGDRFPRTNLHPCRQAMSSLRKFPRSVWPRIISQANLPVYPGPNTSNPPSLPPTHTKDWIQIPAQICSPTPSCYYRTCTHCHTAKDIVPKLHDSS